MSSFKPKGRRAIPDELLAFGKHLVYAEGTKTEPYYVQNIKNCIASKYNCEPNNIDIVLANGKKSYHTVSLVRYAKKDVEKRIQSGERINHVWVFFDKDDFDDFDKAHQMILEQNDSKNVNQEGFFFNKETDISWHSCWSNECFELWLWLYYDYVTAALDRSSYSKKLEQQKELKAIGFCYEKNIENIHDVLSSHGGSIKKAISFANRLETANGQSNPSTGVYKFAEYFLSYMKNN